MERGLYHTSHRTPVSLPQTSLVPSPVPLQSIPSTQVPVSPRLCSRLHLHPIIEITPLLLVYYTNRIKLVLQNKIPGQPNRNSDVRSMPLRLSSHSSTPQSHFHAVTHVTCFFPLALMEIGKSYTVFSFAALKNATMAALPKVPDAKVNKQVENQSQSPWIWHPWPAMAEALPAKGAQPTVPK